MLHHLSKLTITVKTLVNVDLFSFCRAATNRLDKISKELEEEVS